MITNKQLVQVAAATYVPGAVADFRGADGAVQVFRTAVDGLAVYAIEGTHDSLGWALDFMALPLPSHVSENHPDVGWTHSGMTAALDSVWGPLVKALFAEPAYAICGHSLGAALAILATGRMVVMKHPPVQWAAFAPPRVGFQKLIELVATVPGNAYRNGNDPVTDVPFKEEPLWVYEQVPLIRGGAVCRPPWDAHHIQHYVDLVNSLS